MNELVRKALAATTAANQVAQRLALTPISPATRNCSIGDDNQEFLTAINAADEATKAAFDSVSGEQLTALDTASDLICRARAAYYRNIDNNRRDAADLTEQAKTAADNCNTES